jgi:hypothetical protein
MEPTFFATPVDFRAWLERHHERHSELIVGFHKRGSGQRRSAAQAAAVSFSASSCGSPAAATSRATAAAS